MLSQNVRRYDVTAKADKTPARSPWPEMQQLPLAARPNVPGLRSNKANKCADVQSSDMPAHSENAAQLFRLSPAHSISRGRSSAAR